MAAVGPRLQDVEIHTAVGDDVHRTAALNGNGAAEAEVGVLAFHFNVFEFYDSRLVAHSNRRHVGELERLRLELQDWHLHVRLKLRGRLKRAFEIAVNFELAVGAVL